jgi:hypothetical protein
MIISQGEPTGFRKVVITLETQDEVDTLFSLVNYVPVYEAHKLYASLQKMLSPKVQYYPDIFKAITDAIKNQVIKLG